MGEADRGRVDRGDLFDEPLAGTGIGEIALGHDNTVGERHLFSRLGHTLEVGFAGDGIDNANQRLQMEFAAQRAVGREGLQYRAGVGETGRLDNHPHKARYRAARPVGEQGPQGFLQIATDVAAETAIAEQYRRITARPQQRVVDADFAILVDDDRGAPTLWLVEQRADQGCLAGAEKTSHRDDWQPRAAGALLTPPEKRRVPAAEKRFGSRLRTPFRACRARRHGGRPYRRSAAR